MRHLTNYSFCWQCVEEYVNSTAAIRYIWGLRYIDDLLVYRTNSIDHFVLQDANFNIVALTNANGTILERYNYTAFGKRNIFDTSFTPRTTTLYPTFTRTFTGQIRDHETGLMLYRNRYYHPTLGRFIQRDPIGYAAKDVNLYRYTGNHIIMAIDPYGYQTTAEKNWCRCNPVCCLFVKSIDIMAKTAAELHKRYDVDKLPDNTVLNAIEHCTAMCYIASNDDFCPADVVKSLGEAHEDSPDNDPHNKAMDLHNNNIGIELARRDQSFSECADKCEEKAKEFELYWWQPLPPGFVGGLPNFYPNFTIDEFGNPGAYLGREKHSDTPPVFPTPVPASEADGNDCDCADRK